MKRGFKRRWTKEENFVLVSKFRKNFQHKQLPTTEEINDVASMLKGRTVPQIRTRVHNLMNDKQKMIH
jgi:hypothetical protein